MREGQRAASVHGQRGTSAALGECTLLGDAL